MHQNHRITVGALCPHKNLSMMFTRASFRYSQRAETRQASISGSVDRQNVTYLPNGRCSAVKRNKVPTQVTAETNLENTALSERSQTQRPHVVCFHLYEIFRINRQIHRGRKQISGCQGKWGVIKTSRIKL